MGILVFKLLEPSIYAKFNSNPSEFALPQSLLITAALLKACWEPTPYIRI